MKTTKEIKTRIEELERELKSTTQALTMTDGATQDLQDLESALKGEIKGLRWILKEDPMPRRWYRFG